MHEEGVKNPSLFKGRAVFVGAKGIEPSASRSRTERSTDDLRPELFRKKHSLNPGYFNSTA